MLDYTHNPPQNPAIDWREHLSWGDIVLFRFPNPADGGMKRPPVLRPCAVLEIEHKAGECFATIVRGDDTQHSRPGIFDIEVTRHDALGMAGLDHPTRFAGAQRLTISVRHDGFGDGTKASPIIGRLTGQERDQFDRIRARIKANIDILSLKQPMRSPIHSRRITGQKRSTAPQVIIPPGYLQGKIRPIKLR